MAVVAPGLRGCCPPAAPGGRAGRSTACPRDRPTPVQSGAHGGFEAPALSPQGACSHSLSAVHSSSREPLGGKPQRRGDHGETHERQRHLRRKNAGPDGSPDTPRASPHSRGCACTRGRSVVSDSVTPWTVARQAPLFMGFSRQECWSGLPFPPPGDLPDPGIQPTSPALKAYSLPLSHQGSPA